MNHYIAEWMPKRRLFVTHCNKTINIQILEITHKMHTPYRIANTFNETFNLSSFFTALNNMTETTLRTKTVVNQPIKRDDKDEA